MAEYICEIRTRCTEYGSLTDHERRERVVRCIDCRHSEPLPPTMTERLICNYHDQELVEIDGFCAWGEERTDG